MNRFFRNCTVVLAAVAVWSMLTAPAAFATAYTATKAASSYPTRHAKGFSATCIPSTYALTAALAVNDTIAMVKVPVGSQVFDITLVADDLDTNGTPTITLSVGDGGSATRYINASTVGQAGGAVYITAATHPYTYTANDTVSVKVSAGPATGAATGNVSVTVCYVNP